MKKLIFLLLLLSTFLIGTSAVDNTQIYLARAIASKMGDEPFVVRVHYGEMLLNRVENDEFPDALSDVCADLGINIYRTKPSGSDLRAAAAALSGMDFSGGALNVKKINKKSAPPESSSGVRLYDWYFY